MSDRDAIAEVLAQYAQAADRRDEARLRDCFHANSTHDHAFVGSSAAFCDRAMEILNSLVVTHHQIGTISITVEGEMARSECYFTAYHRLAPGVETVFGMMPEGGDVIIGGRYIDRFEKREGKWRIAHRQGVHDWVRN